MPATDVLVRAVFRAAPTPRVIHDKIRGRDVEKDVWYSVPASTRGIIIACHGTNGSGANWFAADEYVQFTRDAHAAGFAVLSTDAEEVTLGDQNGDGKKRWINRIAQDNVDVANIRIILDTLITRGVVPVSAPLFVAGMSAGGSFAPTLGMQLGARATATYCAEALKGVIAITTIPHMWNNARWDDNEETDNSAAEENYRTLLARRIPTEFVYHNRSPVFAERFLRIAGVSAAQAQALHADLLANGLLDSALFLRMTVSDTLIARIQREPQSYPSITSFTQAQRTDLVDQIRSALANHQFFSDRSAATLRFFEEHINSTDVARVQSPPRFHLEQYPAPARSDVTVVFDLPVEMSVRLTLIDALGREVMVLVQDVRSAGRHTVQCNSRFVFPGLYLLRLEGDNWSESVPIVVVR